MHQLMRVLSDYMSSPELIAIIWTLMTIFFIILFILWFILPFSVFGTKKKLSEIIGEIQKANTWLEELVSENQKMNSWLSEIMSESKRTTAWLSEMKTDIQPLEETELAPEAHEKPVAAPADRRRHPRLEFHCTGLFMGKEAVITDISLGGLFAELEEVPELLKIGQVTNIDVDLPTENESLRMKVKVITQNEKGVGCRYIDLSPENLQAINHCFDEFKNTLPIRESDEP